MSGLCVVAYPVICVSYLHAKLWRRVTVEDQSLCIAAYFAHRPIHEGLFLLQGSVQCSLCALLLRTVQWAVQGKRRKGKKGKKTSGGAAQGLAPNKSSAFMDHPAATLSPAAETPMQGAVVSNVSL